MHSGSQLTDDRLVAWVGLFEQGFGYRGSARQIGVSLESARSLYRRWRIRGIFCMIFCFYISLSIIPVSDFRAPRRAIVKKCRELLKGSDCSSTCQKFNNERLNDSCDWYQ